LKDREDKKNRFENLFLHVKPVKMLLSLRSDKIKYATQVSKSVDCTFSHTVKVLDLFRALGLVNFEKKGRVKNIKLTPDGEDIAHDFEGLKRKFYRLEKQTKEIAVKKK